MQNYHSEGDKLTLTAPAGGVVAGVGYVIGNLPVIAENDVAAGLPFVGCAKGVFELTKTASQTWAEGEPLFYNNTTKTTTKTSASGLFPIGVAAAAALSADTTGLVRLDGVKTTVVP